MNRVQEPWTTARDASEQRHNEPGRHKRGERGREGFDQLLEETLGHPGGVRQPAPVWDAPSCSTNDVERSHAGGIWAQVARRYNVCQLTVSELASLSLTLYEAGVISTLDHLILSASPDDLDLPWGSPLMTVPDAEGRLNWIDELYARRGVAERYRHGKSVMVIDRLLGVLQRLSALAGHGVVMGTA